MPNLLRSVDACLALSRAEACTNLPLKEAIACGVPSVIAANTGVNDLRQDVPAGWCEHQKKVSCRGAGTEGWGETDVDEALDALEAIFQDSLAAKRRALEGSEWIRSERTWERFAAKNHRALTALY
jgi:glycosyltransferase involved in cell wall biosynthesis